MRSLKTVLASVGVLVAALVVNPDSAFAVTSWSIDNAIVAPPLSNGTLNAVSCASATACVSVGSYQSHSGSDNAFIETLSAGAWHVVSAPTEFNATRTELDGVSCASATSCVAVGYADIGSSTNAVIDVLGSGTWSRATVPLPSGSVYSFLDGVSCVSATSCIAVGGHETDTATIGLVYTLAGGTWNLMTAANPAGSTNTYFNAVSCTAATACVAVGSADPGGGNSRALVEVLSGSTWSVTHTPIPTGATFSEFRGVSCTAATACVAVGRYGAHTGANRVLAEQLSGTTWTVSHTANPLNSSYVSLYAVSCASATTCEAVGEVDVAGVAKPLAEAMSGTTWTLAGVQKPVGGGSYLNGVSCTDAATCQAAGLSGSSTAGLPLTETLNGSRWTMTHAGKGTGAKNSQLLGISCATTTACLAVGGNNDDGAAMAEAYNGAKWTLTATPPVPPGGGGGTLWSVSCTSATNCMAVGNYGTDAGARAMGDVWNGTTWTATTAVVPSGASSVLFFAVSCPDSTTCFAAGQANISGHVHAILQKWNGTSWSLQSVGAPSGSTGEFLYAISCSSVTSCLAGGDYLFAGGSAALAETWNGTSWTSVAVPGGDSTEINAISCAASTMLCMAVGYGGGPYAETWNGSTWSPTFPLTPGGASGASFSGVSCTSATLCKAVGSSSVDANANSLAETWNGASWILDTTPNIRAASQTTFEDVSCIAGAKCRAVGEAYLATYVPFGEFTD